MFSKLRLVFSITIVFLSFSSYAQKAYWKQAESSNSLSKKFSNQFQVVQGKKFSFNEHEFKKELKVINNANKNSQIIYFPDTNGKQRAFKVLETPVLSPQLSLKYPDIKSYTGYALDDGETKIRFSVSHNGVQSMQVSPNQKATIFIQKESGSNYVLYTRDPNAKQNSDFICRTIDEIVKEKEGLSQKVINDQVLRKLRLVVTASGEYTQFHGGTVADALAAINATITRVNQIFETDLAVTLELVPNLDQVIYTNAATDPYNGSFSAETQSNLDNVIGSANYDLGILFNRTSNSDGNSGGIGTVCITNRKGRAYVGAPIPQGDFFDIDFVAHEIGHQFGANHTWSFESEGTQVQVEPGTGSTIMGYAGLRGNENVAPNGDDYFHYFSIVQMIEYLQTVSCAQSISLTNNPPTVTPLGNFIIPKSTPFVLTGEATDLDINDILTYTWEQIDVGIVPQSVFGSTNPAGANFRSLPPSTSSERYFPKLSSVLTGELTQTLPPESSPWETLSDIERELNFALTVRDNAIGGGQVASDLVNVFVENNAGPFVVSSQNTNQTLVAGSVETIIWDVANTNMPPINVQTVDILLSIDGGLSFPIILAEGTSNDGSHDVLIPGNATSEARIMIKAIDNIFYAVNETAFEIAESDIVLSMSELEQEMCQGDILVVPFEYQTFNDFDEEASFSIQSPASMVDITIFPETANTTDTDVNISFSNTENLPTGNYPIQLTASSATITKTLTFNLNVFDTGFTEVTLVTPADGLKDVLTGVLLEWEVAPLATSYELELATDTNFDDIVNSVTLTGNSYSPLGLNHETEYFWRVKPINICGEGTYGTPFSFTTTQFYCVNIISNDLPKNILSVGKPTVFSEIEILDDLAIADIDVKLEIDHSFVSDLTVSLTSPSGTTVVLMSNTCPDLENINATFDDDASNITCGGNPTVNGLVKPQGSLGSFNGESTAGVWILKVSDGATGDGGVFKNFSLDICAEGEFILDADVDGVLDDGSDLCLDTPAGTPVDANGCAVLLFPTNNFTVQSQSESCRSNNDGVIIIGAALALDYTITIIGGNTNITDNFNTTEYRLSNLMAGNYTICLNAVEDGVNYLEQCFEVVLEEPELLSVSSKISLDGSTVSLELQGASIYNIELNGMLVQTEKSELTLSLKEGANTLKITTNLDCQGSHEEQFLFNSDVFIYPNPVVNNVTLVFGMFVENLQLDIFASNGSMIKSQNYTVNGTTLELDLSLLSTGLYYFKYTSNEVSGTSKILKK